MLTVPTTITMTMNTFYHHVVVNLQQDLVKHMVGRNGSHLKRYCNETGVDSIWYNAERNIVEIYGPVDRLPYASACIQTHIEFIRSNYYTGNVEHPNSKQYEVDRYAHVPLHGMLTGDDMKHVIGRNGYHFKRITRDARVSFIWYDEDTHSVVICGLERYIESAVTLILEHIDKTMNKVY